MKWHCGKSISEFKKKQSMEDKMKVHKIVNGLKKVNKKLIFTFYLNMKKEKNTKLKWCCIKGTGI